MPISILHIDTSGPAGIVMLAVDGKPVAEAASEGDRDHAARINELVNAVLAQAGISLGHIDAIAVCNGPGSYTGLRIGLATAKGFCYALEKPLLTQNRLELMLHEAATKGVAANTLAILPARAGEYYVAASAKNFVLSPQHISTGDLLNLLTEISRWTIIGNINVDIPDTVIERYIPHNLLNINVWSRVAHAQFSSGGFSDIAYAEPEYLKSAYITASRTDR